MSSKPLHFHLPDHTIFLARHGSHAYGTNLPESDLDFRGVAIPPPSYTCGFFHSFEQHETKPGVDSSLDQVIVDLRKFVGLAADCNPNVIEVLFVSDSDVVSISPEGEMLREVQHSFLSQEVRKRFSGYAFGQLKRIKTHRKWLLDPPKTKPEREDFGLGKVTIAPDMIGAIDKILESEEIQERVIHPSVMELVQAEKRYRAALMHWNQYQSWKTSRNEKRSELEAKFGYDTKHAMHLVRLMRMCAEILGGKGVLVKRPDAEELLSIRRGAWSYDHLIQWAEKQDEEMEKLISMTKLPKEPDFEKLNDLTVRLHLSLWSRLGYR